MTNEGLNELIDCINYNLEKIVEIEKRDISKNETVFYVKKLVLNYNLDNSKKIEDLYFIKNTNKLFIGIVQDLGSNLHWYLKEEYRGNGSMFKPLKFYILPHIFSLDETKEELRITMDEGYTPETYEKSKALAEKLGFIMTEEEEAPDYFLKSIEKEPKDVQERLKKNFQGRASKYVLKRKNIEGLPLTILT
jgi:hypothetical protein